MKKPEHTNGIFTSCKDCKGQGKKRQKLRKKVRLAYKRAFDKFEKSNKKEQPPVKPRGHLTVCTTCSGSGLMKSYSVPEIDKENYPHLAIIGLGIGGIALAVACLHRGIPFTIYERDSGFDARAQGYGLTLQQASKAIQGFGIFELKEGVVSTRHLVHTTDGKVIGEWGMRKWLQSKTNKPPKRTNVHIARQTLRFKLLNQLVNHDCVKWNHQLENFKETENEGVDLSFDVDGKIKTAQADLVVGADGIRSTVRKLLIGEEKTPLQYLDCIVILGICPLANLKNIESDLLDSATVFQTVNGNERIYIMPYDSESIMWQLSFPISEKEAKILSKKEAEALKKEAIGRTNWHSPIPQIIVATEESLISGYPVYDRKLLSSELLKKGKRTTLIGDAAHPMSPFKGQGANQALLDALALAREITANCRPKSKWRKKGIRKAVLTNFESEMLKRSAIKVKDSAEATKTLHSDYVLREVNEPRGSFLKRNKNF